MVRTPDPRWLPTLVLINLGSDSKPITLNEYLLNLAVIHAGFSLAEEKSRGSHSCPL